MASNHPSKMSTKHLHPLTTTHHNRSNSNISATSDACTFHSAHDRPQSSNMELRPLTSAPSDHPTSPTKTKSTSISSPKLEAMKMSRQDSGYSSTPTSTPSISSPRTSTSSTRPSKPHRRSTNSSNPSTKSSHRPRTKRTQAQARTSTSSTRPSLSTRHTSPFPRTSIQNTQAPYAFFHFPSLTPPSLPPSLPTTSEPPQEQEPPPPPPSTIQYWTSDQTRRLEYAAIDAASKGFRGFLIRMVPDCVLPVEKRRTRFCESGDADADDAGSVRRYRLCLPEEKGVESRSEVECGGGEEVRKRPGLLKRWTGLGRGR